MTERSFHRSAKQTRIHVHVAHPDGEAKLRLTAQVTLATITGLSLCLQREAPAVVELHTEQTRHTWNSHFGS